MLNQLGMDASDFVPEDYLAEDLDDDNGRETDGHAVRGREDPVRPSKDNKRADVPKGTEGGGRRDWLCWTPQDASTTGGSPKENKDLKEKIKTWQNVLDKIEKARKEMEKAESQAKDCIKKHF